MRRVLHLGLACALGAAAVGLDTQARAADGGWPGLEAGVDGASNDSGGTPDAGVVDAEPPACAYGDAGFGDGGTPPNTMSPEAILAYYCGDAEMQCVTSPIAFDKTIDLKDAWPAWAQGFDTGWIPQSFPELQVKFVLDIPAKTQVKLSGKLQTTWPEALTLATPGDRSTGFLKFDYGLILSGLYKIDIDVLGYNIHYENAIPYFPQVDFHLLGMKQFDSWAFAPDKVSASALTPSLQVFKFNLAQLVGIPSSIGEAGLALNIKGELQAEYQTLKMQVTPSVVAITTENGATLDNYLGGAFVEYDVHPEGKVTYDGIIHLIPTFYVDLISGAAHFEIPITDFEVSMADLYELATGQQASFLEQDFVFDKVKVHVPLPDIPRLSKTTYDFGLVAVGSGEKLKIAIPNWGEGKARAVGEVDDAMKSTFKVMTQTVYIDPCGSEDITVRFTPKKAGPFQATMNIYSNDPDVPVQQVTLKGEAEGDDLVDPDSGSAGPDEDGGVLGSAPGSGQDGGCGCRMQQSDAGTAGVLAALGLVALAASRRRRQAGRKGD